VREMRCVSVVVGTFFKTFFNLQSPRTVEDGRSSWRFSTQPPRGAIPCGTTTVTVPKLAVTHILRLCSIILTKVLNHSIPQRITHTALDCTWYYTVLSVGADARRLPVPEKQVPHDGAELAAAPPPLRGLTTLGLTADPGGQSQPPPAGASPGASCGWSFVGAGWWWCGIVPGHVMPRMHPQLRPA
jgi:hypothetical protein